MNLNLEINNILDLFNNNKLNKYKFNSLIDKKKLLLVLIIKIPIHIKDNKIKSFKLTYYFPLFNFIIKNLNELYTHINNSELLQDYYNKLLMKYLF